MGCIVLPKYSNAKERIDTDVLADYAKKMSEYYGGVTVRPMTVGCWVDKGKLECEENVVMCSAILASKMSPSEIEEKKEKLFKLAKRAGEQLGQEAIMVWFDEIDDVEFIEGIRKEHLPDKLKEDDYFKKLID